MPTTLKTFLTTKWPFVSASLGVIALIAISTTSFESAPPAKSERETTLSSLSKPGLTFFVNASPTTVQSSLAPLTLTATVQTAVAVDHVTVTWSLPDGVTLSSGDLTSEFSHLDAGQSTSVSLSVTVADGSTKPILVNALYTREGIAIGNGTTISVNQPTIAVKRMNFQSTGDQRIFE